MRPNAVKCYAPTRHCGVATPLYNVEMIVRRCKALIEVNGLTNIGEAHFVVLAPVRPNERINPSFATPAWRNVEHVLIASPQPWDRPYDSCPTIIFAAVVSADVFWVVPKFEVFQLRPPSQASKWISSIYGFAATDARVSWQ